MFFLMKIRLYEEFVSSSSLKTFVSVETFILFVFVRDQPRNKRENIF